MPNATLQSILDKLEAANGENLVLSKSEMVVLVASGIGHESFDHEQFGRFDITNLRNLAPNAAYLSRLTGVACCEAVIYPLAPIIAYAKSSARDTEEARIAELPQESWESNPGIAILMPDRTTLLIDGHHRALRREREGKTDMRFWLWTWDAANKFGRVDTSSFAEVPGLDWGNPEITKAAQAHKTNGENHG